MRDDEQRLRSRLHAMADDTEPSSLLWAEVDARLGGRPARRWRRRDVVSGADGSPPSCDTTPAHHTTGRRLSVLAAAAASVVILVPVVRSIEGPGRNHPVTVGATGVGMATPDARALHIVVANATARPELSPWAVARLNGLGYTNVTVLAGEAVGLVDRSSTQYRGDLRSQAREVGQVFAIPDAATGTHAGVGARDLSWDVLLILGADQI